MSGARAYMGTMVLAVGMAALGGYLLVQPGQRADFSTDGIDWQVDQITWIEQAGAWRGHAQLRAVDITRDAPVERAELLQETCDALLGSHFVPTRAAYARDAVYRVDLGLASVSGEPLISEHALPVTVKDGQCQQSDGTVMLTYPGAAAGWHLIALDPMMNAEDDFVDQGYRLTFRPTGDEEVSLDSFDPAVACEAAVVDDILAANVAQISPAAQVPAEDELDPAITDAFGRLLDQLLSVLPSGWRMTRHVHQTGSEGGKPSFDIAEAEILAVARDDSNRLDRFKIVGTRCYPLEAQG